MYGSESFIFYSVRNDLFKSGFRKNCIWVKCDCHNKTKGLDIFDRKQKGGIDWHLLAVY